MLTILPEWQTNAKVIVIWPHEFTDWNEDLAKANTQFTELTNALNRHCETIVIHPNQIPTNDTWVRDFGPISCVDTNLNKVYANFEFNGYGKYPYAFDNTFNNAFAKKFSLKLQHINMVFEGGNLETDGLGNFIFSSASVLHASRQHLSKKEFETIWKQNFYTKNIIWIDDLSLPNDDTDGHIDNFIRFVNETTIAYLDIQQVKEQLRHPFFDKYKLIQIDTIDSDLPKSYINFLHINNHIFIPSYNQSQVEVKIAKKFNELKLSTSFIKAEHLVTQGGGVHCSTMQIVL